MLTRKQNEGDKKAIAEEIRIARTQLHEKGWSYRKVAPLLKVHHVHLALVLTGRRQSRRLLDSIARLPKNTDRKGNR